MDTGRSNPHRDTGSSGTLEDLLSHRWSCRAFTPHAVPRETVERVLRIAQRSASWCNTQPWRVIVTEKAGTDGFRKALSEHARSHAPETDFSFPGFYTGIHRERRKKSGQQLYEAAGISPGDRAASLAQAAKNFDLFGAPHVAIVTVEDSMGVYGALDVGVYVGSFLLAIEAEGLGGIPQAALAMHSPLVRKHFNIPKNERILLGISFGHPDMTDPVNHFRTSRASLEDTVRWETCDD
ncbi:nitroreductase [Specibacter sp. RAF43]|uniref:nitroreductase n=1 Tax=Specibacter sp. RAF43 TaxID=3233057 RepID=UPI003F9D5E81